MLLTPSFKLQPDYLLVFLDNQGVEVALAVANLIDTCFCAVEELQADHVIVCWSVNTLVLVK